MKSKPDKDTVVGRRVGADAAKGKNHPAANPLKGIRQSGRHTEVIRQANPGRTNQAKGR